MSDSSNWIATYIKLRFFARIRRFLQLKASRKRHGPSDRSESKPEREAEKTEVEGRMKKAEAEEEEEEEGEDKFVILQRFVKWLHFGSWEEKEAAAVEIRRLAAEDLRRRKSMAELGVIQPLVEMVGSEVVGRRRTAVQALIELANGTYTNKALMVEAGILSKLPQNTHDLDQSTRHEISQLLLSLSSLSNSPFPFTPSKILPFLVNILDSNLNMDTKELCLRTLYNISTLLDNGDTLVSGGVMSPLLRLSLVKETSEKALATLGNLAVTLMGKRALENDPIVPNSLIEILTWEEKPKCQESSAYVLMILAHQSSKQREKMSQAGIVQVLLELALLGSPLAQKRALKLLQWFKDERQAKVGPHSGPQTARMVMGSPLNPREADEGKKLMKKIVKQSLYKNLETITRRANGIDDTSRLKAFFISSSSKSLPY